jgi:hypothetical protein
MKKLVIIKISKPSSMSKIVLFTLLFCLAFFSCSKGQREIATNDYNGIIYPQHPYDKDISFIPSIGEMEILEKNLTKNLENILATEKDTSELKNKAMIRKDLKRYKRRYFGRISIEGEKIIMVEFIHPDIIEKEEWKKPIWSVDGGGYIFWRIQYRLKEEEFYDFIINADI